MIRLLEQPLRWAKIVEAKFLQEDRVGINVIFRLRNSATIEKRFFLYEPWNAWSFAKLMQLCSNATRFQELEGKNVKVILGRESDDIKVIAIHAKKSDAVYPCHPYGIFSMKEYTMSQFLIDWYND